MLLWCRSRLTHDDDDERVLRFPFSGKIGPTCLVILGVEDEVRWVDCASTSEASRR